MTSQFFIVKQTVYIHFLSENWFDRLYKYLKKSNPFVDVFIDHSWLYSIFQWCSAVQVEREMLGWRSIRFDSPKTDKTIKTKADAFKSAQLWSIFWYFL